MIDPTFNSELKFTPLEFKTAVGAAVFGALAG